MKYKNEHYSILLELQKYDIKQCIVIGTYKKTDGYYQKAFTIKKRENHWAYIDSTLAELKLTTSRYMREIWHTLKVYDDCLDLSVYTFEKDERQDQKSAERIKKLRNLMLRPLRDININ